MRWIRTKEQKDNLAKYCWDISKLAIVALGLVPLAKPETMDIYVAVFGLVMGILFAMFGYTLDGKEIRS